MNKVTFLPVRGIMFFSRRNLTEAETIIKTMITTKINDDKV